MIRFYKKGNKYRLNDANYGKSELTIDTIPNGDTILVVFKLKDNKELLQDILENVVNDDDVPYTEETFDEILNDFFLKASSGGGDLDAIEQSILDVNTTLNTINNKLDDIETLLEEI